MPVSVICSTCSSKLKAPDSAVGRKTKCPKCGSAIVVSAGTTVQNLPAPVPEAVPVHNPVTVQPRVSVTEVKAAAEYKECPFCSEQILASAKKCRHCGETLDAALRSVEEIRRSVERQQHQSTTVVMNTAASAVSAVSPDDKTVRGEKSRHTAALLALLLGGIGIHKFYLGQSFQGIIYLLLCWTFIPAVISFIEGINYLMMSEQKFTQLYG